MHRVCPSIASENGGQSVQFVDPAAEFVFPAHSTHSPAASALYVPGGHATHSPARSWYPARHTHEPFTTCMPAAHPSNTPFTSWPVSR